MRKESIIYLTYALIQVYTIMFQILIYGRLDERTYFPAYTEFKDGPYMTEQVVKWYIYIYIKTIFI